MVNACLTCRKKLLDETSRFCEPCGATFCDICGVRGFDEALIYCNGCEVYATHRYCLPGSAPVTFHEYVVWFCGDCEPKNLNSTKLANPCSDDVEIIQIANKQNKRKRENVNGKDVGSQLLEPELCDHTDGKSVSDSDDVEIIQIANKQTKRKRVNENKILQNNNSPTGLELVVISDNSEEDKKIEQISEPHGRNLELSCQVQAQPIIDPIWRGTLTTSENNFGSIGRLSGHLSNFACQQVSDVAKLLPELLCTDLVYRSQVWPKGFEKDGPNDFSIALFFFPENERYRNTFDRLVDDMISEDLAMKTIVDNAELLVFPSNVLPLSCWRFRTKFYLWGVFRGIQVSSTSDDKSVTKSLNTDSPSSNYNSSSSVA